MYITGFAKISTLGELEISFKGLGIPEKLPISIKCVVP